MTSPCLAGFDPKVAGSNPARAHLKLRSHARTRMAPWLRRAGDAVKSSGSYPSVPRRVRKLDPPANPADLRGTGFLHPTPVELSGAEPAAARFASWFGESDAFELVHAGSDEVGDRLHVFYRLRVKRPGDPWKVIEQHLFCALDEGGITALDLLCSGFRPDWAGAASKSVSKLT